MKSERKKKTAQTPLIVFQKTKSFFQINKALFKKIKKKIQIWFFKNHNRIAQTSQALEPAAASSLSKEEEEEEEAAEPPLASPKPAEAGSEPQPPL